MAAQATVEITWYINEVSDIVSLTLRNRVRLATEFLRSQVVRNISRPVIKTRGVRSGRIVVTGRSKPGEFPKADTTQLMKSIFGNVRSGGVAVWEGIVGTPIDYGLYLEVSMNRSFLVRTLLAEQSKIIRLLTGPITATTVAEAGGAA
jgi:hypothetical protein